MQSFEFDSLLWWKKSGIWIVAIFVAVAAAAFLTRPNVSRGMRKRVEITEALSNARQIGLALTEFQEEFGQIPDISTIEKVRQKSGSDLKLGTNSSNDLFRQLMASGIVKHESIFCAKISGTHKADNVFAGARALEKGECGFTYFMGATKGCNPNRPIAVTPMIRGTDRFDPKPFQGKAVILRADNSVNSVPIRIKDGHAMVNGQNLMDPSNPIWDGHAPVIAWPDL